MNELVSTATMWLQYVDCRMVQLELEATMLNQSQIETFSLYCLGECKAFFDNSFVSKWKMKDVKQRGTLRKKERIADGIKHSCGDFTWSVEGFVRSDRVYDIKSFDHYTQQYVTDPLVAGWRYSTASIDYPEAYRRALEKYPTPKQSRELVLSLFNQPEKKYVAYYPAPYDSLAIFSASRCFDDPTMFDARFRFLIANCSLNGKTDLLAEALADKAIRLASNVPNMSGRITLSPQSPIASCSDHRQYFNGDWNYRCYGVSGKEVIWKDLPYYFLNGAEWFNLVAPYQQMRLPELEKNIQKSEHILGQRLPTGTIAVRLREPLSKADIEELKNVKDILYDALCPGEYTMPLAYLYSLDKSSFRYGAKPRLQWERIPILPESVFLTKDTVKICHVPRIVLPTDKRRA